MLDKHFHASHPVPAVTVGVCCHNRAGQVFEYFTCWYLPLNLKNLLRLAVVGHIYNPNNCEPKAVDSKTEANLGCIKTISSLELCSLIL